LGLTSTAVRLSEHWDIGGLIWEGLEHYPTVDAAPQSLESALAEWMRTQGLE
jgi:hypothetical protein